MTHLTLFEDLERDAEAGDTRVVWVWGDLDRRTAARLEASLERWIHDDRIQRLVLDIGAVTFMDFVGLDVLAEASRLLHRSGRRLCLRNPVALTPILAEVLELAGIASIEYSDRRV